MSNSMDKLKKLIEDLNKIDIRPFIGYGNPDADILIIGKECAEEDKERLEKFYNHNFEQWAESFKERGFSYRNRSGEEPYDFEHGNFHPIYPFYVQCNKICRTGMNNGGTSATYYYYQRLIDKIRSKDLVKYKKSHCVDFFKDCFITELSDICRKNDAGLCKTEHLEIKEHIRARFDWMRNTNFFNQFKIVILACGPYAKAIQDDAILRKDLFGNASVFYCSQLSRWDKKLDEGIIPEIIKNVL